MGARIGMEFLFECSTRQLANESSESNESDFELNTRREIPYLQAAMYLLHKQIRSLLTRKVDFIKE